MTSSHAKPTKYHRYLKLILSLCILWAVRSVRRKNMTKTRHNCCNVGSLLCQPCTRPRFHRMSPSMSPAIQKGPFKHNPSFHTCGHQSNHSCTRWHIHTFTQNSNVKEKNWLVIHSHLPLRDWLSTMLIFSDNLRRVRIWSLVSMPTTHSAFSFTFDIPDNHLQRKSLSKISELVWTKYQCNSNGPGP